MKNEEELENPVLTFVNSIVILMQRNLMIGVELQFHLLEEYSHNYYQLN